MAADLQHFFVDSAKIIPSGAVNGLCDTEAALSCLALLLDNMMGQDVTFEDLHFTGIAHILRCLANTIGNEIYPSIIPLRSDTVAALLNERQTKGAEQ